MLMLTLLPGCYCGAPGEEYADYDTEISRWRQEVSEYPPHSWALRIAGECDGGRILFLHEVPLDSDTTLFFDAGSRAFLGYREQGSPDFPLVCMALGRYYPRRIRCRDGIVTEVMCGTYYQVGDSFSER